MGSVRNRRREDPKALRMWTTHIYVILYFLPLVACHGKTEHEANKKNEVRSGSVQLAN